MIRTACKSRISGLLTLFALLCLASSPVNASVEQKISQWLSYYSGQSDDNFSKIWRFIEANPDWPAQKTLQLHAESKLNNDISDSKLLTWFQNYPPITPDAADFYVGVMKRAGQESKARAYLQIWWEEAKFERAQQKEFYAKYKQYLTRDSHKRRYDMLVHNGDRANALGIANVLGGGYVALAKARLALAKEDPNANALLSKVPTSLQNDLGLTYERLRWRRRNDLDGSAIALLAKAPEAKKMHSPKEWWLERHILARRMIEDKKYTQAYQIVSAHRQTEGLPFAQAEWLAGWLALSKKNEPAKAFQHFEKLYKNVKSPISKARGSYWAGMASKALNSPDIAQKWFYVAAQYNTTFYGQMAQAHLGQTPVFQSASLPSGYQKYASQELARAAKALSRIGQKKEAGFFIAALRRTANSADDLLHNARLADSMEYSNLSIRAATQANSDYKVLNTRLSHPTRAQDMHNVNGVEWAFVHAIMRQESRFETDAVSHAGALGLMQLMPATAKNTARKLGIQHRKSWLTQRPAHNIQLGSAYLRQMLDRYNQNYAMAAAAYNAGPGRVDDWIEIYGDPRTASVDMIDWIESIPIYETRNYVQRVLEAVYVYRVLFKNQQGKNMQPIHVSY